MSDRIDETGFFVPSVSIIKTKEECIISDVKNSSDNSIRIYWSHLNGVSPANNN
jgi:hypothetical protein